MYYGNKDKRRREIIQEFAKSNLVYSSTLGEWITHYGIDIKADKTTVVKASSKGIVKYIKNDPRYGLTIVIEHTGGYKTVYANLLSTEFVVVGEEVSEGQTIGTVGTTSTFEVLDDPHLHFEILKDDEYLDPQLMLN
jgi:murein DD-endopeptidase MepM/ murein hydrolase activator NlpD